MTKNAKTEIKLEKTDKTVVAKDPGMFSSNFNWDEISMGLTPIRVNLSKVDGRILIKLVVSVTMIGIAPASEKEIPDQIMMYKIMIARTLGILNFCKKITAGFRASMNIKQRKNNKIKLRSCQETKSKSKKMIKNMIVFWDISTF